MSQYRETRILSNAYKYRVDNGSNYKSLLDGREDIVGEPSFGNNYPADQPSEKK